MVEKLVGTKAMRLALITILLLVLAGCAPKVRLFPDGTDPLEEQVLQGEGSEKVLLVNVRGLISDAPDQGLLGRRPSLLQEVVSRLRLAEKDAEVRAVILKINSPGGGVTASDVLHHEIERFRRESGKPVVALLMDVAASGGYYVALPADRIVAHPTSLTGSVGAVFFQPRVTGLMEMAGVRVEVAKSGRNKDMGSPFRESTKEEQDIAQTLINEMGTRFQTLVRQARDLTPEQMDTVATARVFTGTQALDLGLVDRVGYLESAFALARELAELPEDAKLVAYRDQRYANDTAYNASARLVRPALLDAGLLGTALGSGLPRECGVYYLWLPGSE